MFFPNKEAKCGRSINKLIVKKEVHNDLLAVQSDLLLITLPSLPLVITMLFLVNYGLPDGSPEFCAVQGFVHATGQHPSPTCHH